MALDINTPINTELKDKTEEDKCWFYLVSITQFFFKQIQFEKDRIPPRVMGEADFELSYFMLKQLKHSLDNIQYDYQAKQALVGKENTLNEYDALKLQTMIALDAFGMIKDAIENKNIENDIDCLLAVSVIATLVMVFVTSSMPPLVPILLFASMLITNLWMSERTDKLIENANQSLSTINVRDEAATDVLKGQALLNRHTFFEKRLFARSIREIGEGKTKTLTLANHPGMSRVDDRTRRMKNRTVMQLDNWDPVCAFVS